MSHVRFFTKNTLRILFLALLYCNTLLAQQSAKPKSETEKNQANTFNQLLDFSRPGEHHKLLRSLCGKWTFQDAKRTFVKGDMVRKAIYNDRFYNVEITGGKLEVPVADGKMSEESYQGLQIEGYDNARSKFVMIAINNHIGSDIQYQYGSFDTAKKEFTYEWDDELIPGEVVKNKRILKITDATHYTEEYFELKDNAYIKVRQLNYTKTGE